MMIKISLVFLLFNYSFTQVANQNMPPLQQGVPVQQQVPIQQQQVPVQQQYQVPIQQQQVPIQQQQVPIQQQQVPIQQQQVPIQQQQVPIQQQQVPIQQQVPVQQQQQQVPFQQQQQQQQQAPVQQQQQVPVQQQQQVPVQQQQVPAQQQQQQVPVQQQQQQVPVQQQQQVPVAQQQQIPIQQQQVPVQQQQVPVQQQQSVPVQQQQKQIPVQQQVPVPQQRPQVPIQQPQVPVQPGQKKPNKPIKETSANKQPPMSKFPENARVKHNDPELDIFMGIPTAAGSIFEHESARPIGREYVSMTAIVAPGARDCYYYNAKTNFDVDFQVLKGENLDIGLMVVDPEKTPVVIRDPMSEASTPITVLSQFRGGNYAICLDNRKSSYGPKVVFLSIDLRLVWHDPSPEDVELVQSIRERLQNDNSSEYIRQLFENMEKLSSSMDAIETFLHRAGRLQARSRNSAIMDRSMMEANLERVNAWSTFQIVLLLFVGIIQTLMIRSLFDEKSSLYRLWVHDGSRSSHIRAPPRSMPTQGPLY